MTSAAQRLAMKNLPPPPPPPSGGEGIRVMYDEDLGNRLHFKEEIGFGNWGSVWLCRPYLIPTVGDTPGTLSDVKVATKLVHRSKTATTKARVQSLWNEWKVVTSLAHAPHPSIIDFYSFVVTDSYALITMAYHPRLVSVEVPEEYAREWFRSLLSGVDFLHRNGLVHNDIKPANILLSTSSVPVLVDFGFAKQYDPQAPDAFHSNLSYGTPEYLSPERAAGHLHDTRKSDVWSLGVTFFEILIGRTPFEELEGEDFSTKEQLRRYWTLTARGKWLGEWSMSEPMEKMLRRMISPNADLRCTAEAAMADSYWTIPSSTDSESKSSKSIHRKSANFSNSLDPRRIFDGVPIRQVRHKDGFESPSSTVSSRSTQESVPASSKPKDKTKAKLKTRLPIGVDKENAPSVAGPLGRGLDKAKTRSCAALGASRHTQSQPQLSAEKPAAQKKEKAAVALLGARSPPPKGVRPVASAVFRAKEPRDKENWTPPRAASLRRSASSVRLDKKPLGPRQPSPPSSPVVKPQRNVLSVGTVEKDKAKRRPVLVDRTQASVNENENVAANTSGDSVRDRMREWEWERQRLRELARMDELRREEEAEEEERRREVREKELEEEMQKDIERQKLLEEVLEREIEAERQRILETVRESQRRKEAEALLERGRERQIVREQQYPRIPTRRFSSGSTPSDTYPPTPLSPLIEESESSRFYELEPRSPAHESSLSVLKHGFKKSIDRTKRLYKSSTQALGLSTPALSIDGEQMDYSRSRSLSLSISWEDEMPSEGAVKETPSLPVVRSAAQDEQMATANQLDRMTIWLKNVEKVVEDARQNFAASVATPLPPLPVAPVARPSVEPRTPDSRSVVSNRSGRSSTRMPRRILAANQIFVNEYDANRLEQPVSSSVDDSMKGKVCGPGLLPERTSMLDTTIPTIPDEEFGRVSQFEKEAPEAPMTPVRRTRRATILTRSPQSSQRKPSLEIDVVSPGHKEKAKSQHDLGRPITPVTRLEFELQQFSKPQPPPRLSQLVDKTIFISNSAAYNGTTFEPIYEPEVPLKDDLTDSPYHVEPYPPRPMSKYSTLDTPGRKHVEGVYDRFLMSTTGVKRVGQGYQSDGASAVPNARPKVVVAKRNFLASRRAMPPPVSSEDLRRSAAIDEFGAMSCAPVGTVSSNKEDGSGAVSIVKRAIKAITVKR